MLKNKEFSSNRFILPALFIVFSILIEMVNFIWLGFQTDTGMLQVIPTYFLFDLGVIFMIAGIIYLVTNKHAMLTIFYIVILLQIIMSIVNATMYNVFGDLFTFDYIKLGEEAVAAIRPEFIDWPAIGINIAILAVIIIVTVVLYKKNKSKVKLKIISNWIFALALVILIESCGFTMFAVQNRKLSENSNSISQISDNDAYLWDNLQFKSEAYQKFGYYGFYYKNIYNMIHNHDTLSAAQQQELVDYVVAGKTWEGEFEAPLADDNLIVILCESNEWFAYDPILTPTIWQLANGSAASFTNFYTHNKTNIGEGISLMGSMPKQLGLWDLVGAANFDDAYTLPKLYKEAHADEPVQTNFFHSYLKSFYDRESVNSLSGIGFDTVYGLEDYTGQGASNQFGNWVSDADYIASVADKMIPDEGKFFSYYTSVSTHGPYNSDNPNLADCYETFDNNYEEFENWFLTNTEYAIPSRPVDFQEFRRYKAAAIDFDNAISKIFQTLEEKGRLEDTTVVMFADHTAFYNNFSYRMKNISKSDFSNIEAHRVPLVIYNSKLEAKEYTSFCNIYDIFPTICQLHGLAYNKNLVHGYNLFSKEIAQSFFASHINGMFNQKIYSKNIEDVISLTSDVTQADVDQFRWRAEQFYAKQDKIEKIYKYNLAKKI